MATPLQIAERLVGPGQPCLVVAEIGVNHNGDVHLAHKIVAAAVGGYDPVTFQKRTVDMVYSEEKLAQRVKSVYESELPVLEKLRRVR